MINSNSITATNRLQFGEHFVKPAYGSYCFAHIPDTIKQIFGIKPAQALPDDVLAAGAGYEHVILMLVDAFGWRFFENAAKQSPFLKQLTEDGVVSRMTSMFPSTTAAHVTCIHSGLSVAQSGVYEWFYYEPKVDQVIAPLLFSPAGEQERDLLAKTGVKPEQLFPAPTLYQALHQQDVVSYIFVPNAYVHSSYNQHISRGAESVPYITWTEALTNLTLLLEQTGGRTYTHLYFSLLDAIAHPYGPTARQFENELETFLLVMAQFYERLQKAAGQKRTLLLITADHGIAMTDPQTTIYLNQHLPELANRLQRRKNGEPILFGGSPRDLFLYVQEKHLDGVHDAISQLVAGKAEVHRTQALIEAGVFGPGLVTEPFASRLGNLVVLAYPGEAVSWYEKGRFEQKYYGHHGGLTPEEMYIPLMALELG